MSTGGTIQEASGYWDGTSERTKISYSTRAAGRQAAGMGPSSRCDCPQTRKPLFVSGRRRRASRARKRCVARRTRPQNKRLAADVCPYSIGDIQLAGAVAKHPK
jgi:hypothetical protein